MHASIIIRHLPAPPPVLDMPRPDWSDLDRDDPHDIGDDRNRDTNDDGSNRPDHDPDLGDAHDADTSDDADDGNGRPDHGIDGDNGTVDDRDVDEVQDDHNDDLQLAVHRFFDGAFCVRTGNVKILWRWGHVDGLPALVPDRLGTSRGPLEIADFVLEGR